MPLPDELIPGIDVSGVTKVTGATEVSTEKQSAGWKNKFKKIFKKGSKEAKIVD